MLTDRNAFAHFVFIIVVKRKILQHKKDFNLGQKDCWPIFQEPDHDHGVPRDGTY